MAGSRIAPLSMFSGEHAVFKRLCELDPDTLTPREALELLYQLRRQLDE